MNRNPKAISMIILGSIAKEMGAANGRDMIKASESVVNFVSTLTHKELSELKKLKREKKVEDI